MYWLISEPIVYQYDCIVPALDYRESTGFLNNNVYIEKTL